MIIDVPLLQDGINEIQMLLNWYWPDPGIQAMFVRSIIKRFGYRWTIVQL